MATTDSNLPPPEQPPSHGVLTRSVMQGLLSFQNYAELTARAMASVLTPPHYIGDLLEQMDIIGVGSLPVVLITGFFIGAVMVLQTATQFARFGQTSLTGDAVSTALVRELGPTITGLLVAGRNSSGMASELGSMLVTEQVDAMRAMGTDPIRKLVAPRVFATILMLPLLVAMSDLIGLVGGFFVSLLTLHLNSVEFWHRAIHTLDFSDLMQGLTKPLFFGFIIATVGCYKGLSVKGGTQGVGRATTQAVVISSVAIIATDVVLTRVMLYFSGHPL
ncbi:MAG TPA: ABC transporter permease [Candidatus Acidoferrales bacterium]